MPTSITAVKIIKKKIFSGSFRLIHTPRKTPRGTSGRSTAETDKLVTDS
jgi:hypothetical protein